VAIFLTKSKIIFQSKSGMTLNKK